MIQASLHAAIVSLVKQSLPDWVPQRQQTRLVIQVGCRRSGLTPTAGRCARPGVRGSGCP